MTFESSYKQLQGTVTAFAVQGLGPNDVSPPTTIIRADQAWRVHIEWKTEGLVAAIAAGEFHVSAYLESIGPGADLKLPVNASGNEIDVAALSGAFTTLPLPTGGRREYHADIDVPAGLVPIDIERSRPYLLVVTITYTEPTGAPGSMAAFVQGPVLQFFAP